MNSKVSVVIPCFNGEKYLGDAIKSILNQSHKADEIIVVDDGSTDSTKEIATSFDEVTYLFHKNNGVSFSRNRGLKECTGKYVIFLDADDLLPENRIKEDCKLLDEMAEIGYVFGWFDVIDEKGRSVRWERNKEILNAGYHSILAGKATVSPGAVSFRTKCLRQMDEVFNSEISAAEDLDLYLRFSRKFPIYCHNRIALKYRTHQSNWSGVHGATKTLSSILQQLNRQKEYVSNDTSLMRELRVGIKHWKMLLGPRSVGELITSLKLRQWKRFVNIISFLLINCPYLFFITLSQKIMSRLI